MVRWMAHAIFGQSPGVRTVVVWAALAPLVVGCEGTTMSAHGTRVPALVGPVACIGCAPAPAPVWLGPALQEEAYFQYLVAGGATMTSSEWQRQRPMLARNAERVVRNPCAAEMHVRAIAASSFGIFGIFIGMQRVSVEVEATPAGVPNGWCGARPAPPRAIAPPPRAPDGESDEDGE